MRTCTHCGCNIVLEGDDAFGTARWVTETGYGTNRHCGGKDYPTGYHEPTVLVPDLTNPDAVASWLLV